MSQTTLKNRCVQRKKICEQRNRWISGYSSICANINYDRFQFFMYLIFNTYNQIVIDGKLEFGHSNFEHTSGRKRTISDEEDEYEEK